MIHPIDNVTWIDSNKLNANDYNPNVVFSKELKLLEFSILKNGWIQPILITKSNVIIDGYHRWYLSINSKSVNILTNGTIPCCIIDLCEPERMLLTIRINRAKGSHIAINMSKIIKCLINEYQYTVKQISEGIGATKDEIELLLMDNVFKALDIKNHEYSKAWYPKR